MVQGFSGAAWLREAPPQHVAADWTEPGSWLALRVDRLGTALTDFVRTNEPAGRLALNKPRPALTPVQPAPVALRTESTVEITDGLARRELLAPVRPPPVQHADVVSNTIVALTITAVTDLRVPEIRAKLIPAAETRLIREKRSGSVVTASVEMKPPIEWPTR